MKQTDFADRPYTPHVPGSATSEAAAKAKRPTALTDKRLVLDHIRSCGENGSTDDEIEYHLSMLHQNASARRRGLCIEGLVVDSGKTRKTRSNRSAVVWIAR